MEDVFVSDPDEEVGKIVKRARPNALGEAIYLRPDGTLDKDEDKIISVQRIFKKNFYKPEGRGALKILERLEKQRLCEHEADSAESHTNKTNMSVSFITMTKVADDAGSRLEPAPSVTDWEAISEALKAVQPIASAEDLRVGAHVIHATYRGGQMWLYPNARFNRFNPVRGGGNGLTATALDGDEEDVELRVNGAIYSARVKYNYS